MSAPFCTYKRKEKNGIFTGNKLESIVDFFKDRSSGYDNCLFSGNFLCKKIMKLKPASRAILDGILTMPLVLPPTVAGFFSSC